MLLVVVAALAVLTVPVAGGRLGRLADLRLRSPWLLAAALGAQVLIISVVPGGDGTAPRVLHLLTYVAVIGWVVRNRELLWRWIVVLGGALNLLVIAVNEGVMPASRTAVQTAGLGSGEGFENSASFAGAELSFLGDVFAVPSSLPLANVYSVGDILIVMGIAAMLHRQCESFLAYVGARAGDLVLGAVARVGGPNLGAWRMNGSHGRSRRSTKRTPPIPIAS